MRSSISYMLAQVEIRYRTIPFTPEVLSSFPSLIDFSVYYIGYKGVDYNILNLCLKRVLHEKIVQQSLDIEEMNVMNGAHLS